MLAIRAGMPAGHGTAVRVARTFRASKSTSIDCQHESDTQGRRGQARGPAIWLLTLRVGINKRRVSGDDAGLDSQDSLDKTADTAPGSE